MAEFGECHTVLGNIIFFVYYVPAFWAVVVAEVTKPSHGVGYEIRAAVELEKKVLCLFYEDSGKSMFSCIAILRMDTLTGNVSLEGLSPMIGGDPSVTVKKYKDTENLKEFLLEFFSSKWGYKYTLFMK